MKSTEWTLLLLVGVFLLSWNPAFSAWDEEPSAQGSLRFSPSRENATTHAWLRTEKMDEPVIQLALKRFLRVGAQPVLLIHGLAQNDLMWDAATTRYNFARFLHAQGFDVWIGNMRGAGTAGFKSQAPAGPRHWTIDDYAVHDLPALVQTVREKTGRAPILIGHSLAAWVFEGYFAGLDHNSEGVIAVNRQLAIEREKQVRGVVTLAGVYNLSWEKSLAHVFTDPLQRVSDLYDANYELELLARSRLANRFLYRLPTLSLNWVQTVLSLPLERIPFIGKRLQGAYAGFWNEVAATPLLFSMLYYAPNCDEDLVRLHASQGLEDLPPHVLQQLRNAIVDGHTSTYYDQTRHSSTYAYGSVRANFRLPILFVAGERDRLANDAMIFRDGYEAYTQAPKTFLRIPDAGHLDIISGKNAPAQTMTSVARWLHDHF